MFCIHFSIKYVFYCILLTAKYGGSSVDYFSIRLSRFYIFTVTTITFLATWGCSSDFLKMLPKFKMAARGQLKKFCGWKNSKTWSQKLFNFYYNIRQDMERWFLQGFTKIQNSRHRSMSNFLGRKNSQKLCTFYNHIPHDIEMCRWFFQGFT